MFRKKQFALSRESRGRFGNRAGPLQITGDFIDHRPPFPFSPEDKVDPKVGEFRMTAPVLIRGEEVVFNMAGMSGGLEDKPGTGDAVYSPSEGRFLFSFRPFKRAVEGKVFDSQVEFRLKGQTLTGCLLRAPSTCG
jgi:hypothetical protein